MNYEIMIACIYIVLCFLTHRSGRSCRSWASWRSLGPRETICALCSAGTSISLGASSSLERERERQTDTQTEGERKKEWERRGDGIERQRGEKWEIEFWKRRRKWKKDNEADMDFGHETKQWWIKKWREREREREREINGKRGRATLLHLWLHRVKVSSPLGKQYFPANMIFRQISDISRGSYDKVDFEKFRSLAWLSQGPAKNRSTWKSANSTTCWVVLNSLSDCSMWSLLSKSLPAVLHHSAVL